MINSYTLKDYLTIEREQCSEIKANLNNPVSMHIAHIEPFVSLLYKSDVNKLLDASNGAFFSHEQHHNHYVVQKVPYHSLKHFFLFNAQKIFSSSVLCFDANIN